MNRSELAYRARRRAGLSQRAFARLIGASPATVARWESGVREPSAVACTLLRLIDGHPQARAWLRATRRQPSPQAE